MTNVWLYLATLGTGILGWAFGIEPKIKAVDRKIDSQVALLDQKYADLKELINTRFDNSDDRLTRIETALNGSLRR